MDDLDVIDVGGPEELMFSEEYMTGLNSQIAEVIGGGGKKKKRRQRNERRDIKRERLYVEGFRYNFDRDSSCGQRAFWRCVKKGECLARVHTRVDTGEVIKSTGKHCHPPCYDHTKGEPNPKSSRCSTTSPSDRLDSLTEKSPSPFISSSDDVCSSSTMVAVKEEEDDEDSINQYPHSVISALSHPLHSPSMDEQSTSDYPEDTEFIKIFALTKEVVNFVKTKMENDVPSSSCMEDLEPCQEVKLFLTNRRMGNYCGIFAKFTLSEMRALSSEDCRVICANDAEGLRLYHSLRQRQSASSSSKLRIFVAPKLDEEEEPCYELLNLIPPTVSELQNCLHSKGMMGPEVTKICVTGPNGINVQLSDEILETWEDNSVFQCYSSTNVLKMIPVNDSS